MAKFYFKYGAMGSSKTAQALITRFNYEEKGIKTWLLKPSIDTRDGADVVKSRIGLEARAEVMGPGDSILGRLRERFGKDGGGFPEAVICDEAQFFTPGQVEELRNIADGLDIPVMCFGLKTDFRTRLFPGSQRLLELADSVAEIKTVCACGKKAVVNARVDPEGRVVTEGEQVEIGGNERYVSMCYRCWQESQKK